MLVDRTKAEVAGTLLTAQLALTHGLACNTAGGRVRSALVSVGCLWGILDFAVVAMLEIDGFFPDAP